MNKIKKLSKIFNYPELQKLSNTKNYIIKPGDNFSKLSGGDPLYLKLILEANPDVNPSKLQIGQEIILPSPPERPNMNMQPSQAVKEFIKSYEGRNSEPILIPYDDGFGNITVGWGHNLGKIPLNSAKKITLTEAENLFEKDVQAAAEFVRKNVMSKLSQGKFDALTSLVFNAGANAVFKTKLFKLIDKGHFISALQTFPDTLIGENQGGLVSRRLEETKMFMT